MKRSKTKKKVSVKENIIDNYLGPSIIFGTILTGFNFCLLWFSLYSKEYSGLYFDLFGNIYVDTFINIIFDVILFSGIFLLDTYLLIEVIILDRHK